eukprot:gnl/Spiro4/7009_TR3638_c0_g1_i1.p1 gnl/Spiro4/7009_TR3638_c0_g1~~gnl/Spiro4/7009_TR3638_c0_g1_i1.p1  ORF type:complete len:711 (+),score=187.76 gnl/Spiro4/7009_TR3638_c0_g1_i1:60-2135(+)
MRTRSRMVLCFVLVVLVVVVSGDVQVQDKLFSTNNNYDDDPRALNDVFLSVPERELSLKWSGGSDSPLTERLDWLRSFELVTYVNVKLVGFEKDGQFGVDIKEEELMRYLDALKTKTAPQVIETQPGQPHHMGFKTRFLFQVSRTSRSLVDTLAASVNSAIERSGKSNLIPHTTIDDTIKQNFLDMPHQSYTLYILNLPAPTAVPATQYNPPVAGYHYYAYYDAADKTPTACGSSVWVGQERYAWMDLTAGPVTYGPSTSGDGTMTEFSLPRVTAAHSKLPTKSQLLADLASVIYRSCQYLFAPSIDRTPTGELDPPEVDLHLFSITDRPADRQTHFDWAAISSQLQGLTSLGQTLELGQSQGSFVECELCVSALSHSSRSHTSNILAGGSSGLRTVVHQYVDAAALHRWLRHFDTNAWGLTPHNDTSVRVVPVFLYDLDSPNILLLDRFHQALPFDNMVLAIQTQVPSALLDFNCANVAVSMPTMDATRAVLAAILQTVWGVPPIYKKWSPVHNSTLTDYMWAVGHTPFGYFSTSKTLSFVSRDTALRNPILALFNHTLASLQTLFADFAYYGKELDHVLTDAPRTEFVRRWNVLAYKLSKSAEFLAFHNFNQSIFYLRSAKHEIRAITSIVQSASRNLGSTFVCAKYQPWIGSALINWAWLILLVGVVAVIVSQYTSYTLRVGRFGHSD